LPGPIGTLLGELWLDRRCPYIVENLKITKALARELALDLNSFPALETVCGRPIANELAVGVCDWRLKLGLNHVDIVRRGNSSMTNLGGEGRDRLDVFDGLLVTWLVVGRDFGMRKVLGENTFVFPNRRK
jgi:hypothetical protein